MSSSNRSRKPSDQPVGKRSLSDLTRRQRTILILAMIAVPLVALPVLELGLRAVGYGSSYPLFVPFEPAPEYLVPNPEVGQRYFRHEAGTPAPLFDLFRTEKAADTYRVFVQGGSTTAGFPYSHGGAFSRMLEQRLQETFPDRAIEVVNTALDATTTYTLLDMAPEIIEQDPDAVVLYTGHNEYYGVLGVASGESVGRMPWVVATYIGLRKLRLVQAMEAAFDAAARAYRAVVPATDATPRTLMEYLASEHTVRYGSETYWAGIRQFRRNLDRLLALYTTAGIPVYIGTLGSNERDQAPFISEPDPSLDPAAWHRLVDRAKAAFTAGDAAAAGAAIDAAVALDSTAADPFYLRGRLLEATGDTAAARTAYQTARDRDQLPFRAPAAINGIIRELAAEHGATTVATMESLTAESPGGILDNTLFLEHLHPNIEGQFILADAYYRALQADGAIGEWKSPIPRQRARERVPLTVVDSLAGAYMIERLRSRFPFQPAGSRQAIPTDTLRPTAPLQRIALAYHRRQISWAEAMNHLQQHYATTRQWERVAHVHGILAQELAHTPMPLVLAAMAYTVTGKPDAAMRHLERAEKRLPTAEGARLMGNILLLRGDTTAARAQYDRGAGLDPSNRRVAAAGQALAAIPGLEAAVRESPADPDALADLAITQFLTGQFDRARVLADSALRLSPGHSGAEDVLERLGAFYRVENE